MQQGEQSGPWWLEEPLSIIELSDMFQTTAGGEAAFDPEGLVRRATELNATAAHVFPLGGHLDGRTLFFRHNSPGDPPAAFDYLEGWLTHAQPAGLRTVVYFNVHAVKGDYAPRHPDWQQRRQDGSPKDDVYTIESAYCVNTPWRDWVFDRLRELCAYPIDGVFFDGPLVFADCCYCDCCRRLFRQRYGIDMPAKGDRMGEGFPKLVEFSADSLAAFLADSREVIKSTDPDILFYMNSNTVGPNWATGRDNRRLAQYQDILAAEGGFFYGDLMTAERPWKVAMNARLLEAEASAARLPTLVFDCIAHKPWTYYMLPPAEVALMWASSVANGAGTWLATMKDSIDESAVEAVGPLYEFARRYRRELFETVSAAECAIMVSKATMNYYAGADVPLTDFTAATRGAEAGNFRDELNGWYRALGAMQAPFDLIDDWTVEREALDRYRLIVLPNAACLSDRACAALGAYVRAGGTLVGTFETGFYDETGRRRAAPALAEVFGIVPAGAGGTPAAPGVEGPRKWDYLFRHGQGPWADSIEAGYIPSPRYALRVEAAAGAEVALTFSEGLTDRYAGLPVDSLRPAMIVNPAGAGRAFYFACDVGAAMHAWRLGEHFEIVRSIVEACAPPAVRVEGAPASLEVSLRRSRHGRELMLHLVNYTGGMTRPIRRVVPLHGLAAALRANGEVRSVRALWAERELAFTADGEAVRFELPVIRECEMVLVEY